MAQKEANKGHRAAVKKWMKQTGRMDNSSKWDEQKEKCYDEFNERYDQVQVVQDAKLEQINIAKEAIENLNKIKSGEVVPVVPKNGYEQLGAD